MTSDEVMSKIEKEIEKEGEIVSLIDDNFNFYCLTKRRADNYVRRLRRYIYHFFKYDCDGSLIEKTKYECEDFILVDLIQTFLRPILIEYGVQDKENIYFKDLYDDFYSESVPVPPTVKDVLNAKTLFNPVSRNYHLVFLARDQVMTDFKIAFKPLELSSWVISDPEITNDVVGIESIVDDGEGVVITYGKSGRGKSCETN